MRRNSRNLSDTEPPCINYKPGPFVQSFCWCFLDVRLGLAGCSDYRAGDHHVSFKGVGCQLQSGSTSSSGSEQLGQVEDSHTG